MKLQEMMNQISALGAQIKAASQALAKDSLDNTIPLSEIEKKQADIADMQTRMTALQASYDAVKGEKEGGLKTMENKEMTRSEIRKSNEYVRAFAYALKHGITKRNGLGNENVKILYDALTEGGGDPVGTDGGFLVPEDIDNQIRELKRELNPLAPLFTEESVTAQSGWRVIDTAPTSAMPSIDEMGTIANNSDQPAFAKVTYSLTKYGLRIPISNELLNDEVANLMGYLARWFAKKLVLTENSLLITALKTLDASALTTGSVTPDSAIKAILNKTLDPAISLRSVILTNQTGFDALDQLTDEMGRGLLQPDPTNATLFKTYGRRVVMVSDAQLPNTSNKPEFFIGDLKEFATLFRRNAMEIASTDIGGNAWATDSTEVRGLVRMCVSKFDASAAVRRQLTLS
jgi:HK97 family phage major capsid protein